MTRREWLLSILFLGFVLLKVAELAVPIEHWPLSNVYMFSQRVPPSAVPKRMRIRGLRDGAWVPLASRDLHLTDDELARRLRTGPTLGRACSTVVQPNSARLRLERAEIVVEDVPRPGVPSMPQRLVLPCPLEPPPAPRR
jgi:hypothetical protein